MVRAAWGGVVDSEVRTGPFCLSRIGLRPRTSPGVSRAWRLRDFYDIVADAQVVAWFPSVPLCPASDRCCPFLHTLGDNPLSSLGDWRIAASVLPRRTLVRVVALCALAPVISACGNKNGGVASGGGPSSGGGSGAGASPAALALGKFAAGTWTVSTPDAEYNRAKITISDSGTWAGTLSSDQAQQSEQRSGTWALSGGQLRVTFDDHDAMASGVPGAVGEDTSAQFSWSYNGREPDSVQAGYDARTKTVTLTRKFGRITQTMTARRS